MPYTVHTLDGQAHTYHDPCIANLTDAGLLALHEDATYDEDYGRPVFGPLLAAYPAGQWTHYHVEPAPYETDAQASEDTDEARRWNEVQVSATAEAVDKWKAMYQRHLDAGRKAAAAQ
ncbi:hypothetical protein BJF89_13905 [Corynebacterium sp. CNJ-954]|uniref:hypothetical protein n=1 Tax=Corynebacterium sp. CNJ-954 TaxID=1904962 RepID=UPI00096516C4|nr:hypothetical protein [Corynebacterium sp. CNJ-954]OLT55874.1 hypothetical protein BJF89_13905 [Corynebacterium sp. CNJ-954]